ncbi:hypothetical protein TNCT_147811 [Trichonephila clavata]|uniref:Uncharacterized protein n=1 Tax=Trichonephila clavata TaxID=2740835 RepID=A0A8X6F2C9_TRICU|nr:hypothetical protein TNCT_147811 [Trichonephila clavata]
MATAHLEVLFIYESFRDANHLSPAINSAISVTSNPRQRNKKLATKIATTYDGALLVTNHFDILSATFILRLSRDREA